ncbi:MAG: radical SAM protein, partial [Oscillospiraceae bacterium]|nr:radical SAM protein [Oscillospiraceae bacterium]
FCVVGEKEGLCSKQVADLDEFWRGQKEIKLLDPNILACGNYESLLKQLAESKARVDFTQGLDIRLTNPDNIDLLNKIKVTMLHFAWDNPKQDLTKYFRRFSEHTRIKSDRNKAIYVLTNYNSTLEEDLYRIYTLRELGYSPYVMIYQKENAPKEINRLQRWVNCRWIFRTVNKFEDYKG